MNHFIAYKVLGLVMLRSICLKPAHVWPPGDQPTNPRRRRQGITLEETSEEEGEAQEAFKDAINDSVDKDF